MSSEPTVYLAQASVGPVLRGHPWIYSGSIEKTNNVGDDCDQVLIRDGDGRVLGHGFYSPDSHIRVRVHRRTSHPALEPLNRSFFRRRIASAVERRRRLGLPSDQTDAYRLINGAGDGLPGATVERRGHLVLFHLMTRALVHRRQLLVDAMRQVLKEEGGGPWHIAEVMLPRSWRRREGFDREVRWYTEQPAGPIEFRENGIRFASDLGEFQKTGFDATMRPHRRWVAERCRGRRVLDGFSYTGGFGLCAGLRDAASVTCVEASKVALSGIEATARANGIAGVVDTVNADLGDFLRSAYDRNLEFDIAVVDPPNLAVRERNVSRALSTYESLVVQLMRLVDSGGIIGLGASSRHIGADELESVFGACCRREARCSDIVYRGAQPPDVPVPPGMEQYRELTFVAAQIR